MAISATRTSWIMWVIRISFGWGVALIIESLPPRGIATLTRDVVAIAMTTMGLHTITTHIAGMPSIVMNGHVCCLNTACSYVGTTLFVTAVNIVPRTIASAARAAATWTVAIFLLNIARIMVAIVLGSHGVARVFAHDYPAYALTYGSAGIALIAHWRHRNGRNRNARTAYAGFGLWVCLLVLVVGFDEYYGAPKWKVTQSGVWSVR